MGSGTIFKVGEQVHVNIIRTFNMTSLTFKQVYSKFNKPSTTPICTTPYLSYTAMS